MSISKDPESRREDILKAALELFREVGFVKVTVESIAKEAGISKGSFYNYYKSKEEVYMAVISNLASNRIHITNKYLSDKNVSPKVRLAKYIDWTCRLSDDQEKSLSRIFDSKENAGQQQMYLRILDEGISQMLPIFENLLEEGVASGEFDIVNPRFTAVTMLGAFRNIHITFYNILQIDIATGKTYLNDFISRLLGTNFYNIND